MSQLDTLVPDIEGMLQDLSQGKQLKISNEELDLLAANIKEATLHWSIPQDRSGFRLRMSNLGKPLRQLWYEAHDETPRAPPKAWDQLKFLYGHLLEQVVLMLVRVSGHNVEHEQLEVDVQGIKGHLDSVIDGQVVDVKTASQFAFRKFVNGTLADDDPFGYLAQLSGYEHALETDQGGFLVMNKESGEITLHCPDDFDKIDVPDRIEEIKTALVQKDPPPRCYPEEPHGTKGNMKIAKGCKWCRYKNECFKDANDGQGLRVFKYSKEYVHLTKVVDQPRVEEVL